MTNRKSTKRALLGSVVAMVLCLAMLVGATFAWGIRIATSGLRPSSERHSLWNPPYRFR